MQNLERKLYDQLILHAFWNFRHPYIHRNHKYSKQSLLFIVINLWDLTLRRVIRESLHRVSPSLLLSIFSEFLLLHRSQTLFIIESETAKKTFETSKTQDWNKTEPFHRCFLLCSLQKLLIWFNIKKRQDTPLRCHLNI